jgi:hypothetical protein
MLPVLPENKKRAVLYVGETEHGALFFCSVGRLDKSEKPHADASGLSGGSWNYTAATCEEQCSRNHCNLRAWKGLGNFGKAGVCVVCRATGTLLLK